MPFFLTEIDRYTDALILVVLNGLDFRQAYAHRLTKAFRYVDLASAGPLSAGLAQDLLREVCECAVADTEDRIVHMYF